MRDFIHRFGSSQNGHVHFDVGLDDWVAVDHWTSRKRVVVAVWLRCDAVLRFAPKLTSSEGQCRGVTCGLEGTTSAIATQVCCRTVSTCRKTLPGSAWTAVQTSRNSTTSSRRSPLSYLDTNDCGRPSRPATSICVNPAFDRASVSSSRRRTLAGL